MEDAEAKAERRRQHLATLWDWMIGTALVGGTSVVLLTVAFLAVAALQQASKMVCR